MIDLDDGTKPASTSEDVGSIPSAQILQKRRTRLTLTPRGVDLLGKCGLLPSISESEIEDKSKEDALGKAISCLQVTWMVVQVIGRLALRLPITLLEINTIGHVLCALVVYCMWWYKPRWVLDPTRVHGGRDLWCVVAFMVICSQVSAESEGTDQLDIGIFRDFGSQPEINKLAYFPRDDPNPGGAEKRQSTDQEQEQQQTAPKSPVVGYHSLEGHPDRQYGHFAIRPVGENGGRRHLDMDRENVASGWQDQTSTSRWALAAEAVSRHEPIYALLTRPMGEEEALYENALRTYPEIPARFVRKRRRSSATMVKELLPNSTPRWLECPPEQFVVGDAAPNWPSEDLLKDKGGLMMGSVLWFASVGYSAVHLAAWNTAFPTVAEMWLWRGASLYLGFSGVLWLLIMVVAQFSRTIWWYWYHLLARDRKGLGYIMLLVICGICGSMYCVSRIFVVVEAFVSLRSLPVGAYLCPEWTVSVPHL